MVNDDRTVLVVNLSPCGYSRRYGQTAHNTNIRSSDHPIAGGMRDELNRLAGESGWSANFEAVTRLERSMAAGDASKDDAVRQVVREALAPTPELLQRLLRRLDEK